MKVVSIAILLLVAGLLQALLPAPARLGQPAWPILPTLVLYFACTRERPMALVVAVTAGVVQDALGLGPLGYSTAALATLVIAIRRYRGEVFESEAVTHVVLGALGAATVTLLTGFLLRANGHIEVPWGTMLVKTAGSAVLGAVLGPSVFWAASRFEQFLGLHWEVAP